MTNPDFVDEEQPVEDVLEQRRDDAPELDERGAVPPTAEANEADYAEQQIAVPDEDDYSAG